jgi:hypothetical protein
LESLSSFYNFATYLQYYQFPFLKLFGSQIKAFDRFLPQFSFSSEQLSILLSFSSSQPIIFVFSFQELHHNLLLPNQLFLQLFSLIFQFPSRKYREKHDLQGW